MKGFALLIIAITLLPMSLLGLSGFGDSIINSTLEETASKELLPDVDATFLGKNFPNPFNPNTVITYGISEESSVSLLVFNMKGQKVRTLFDGTQVAGSYAIEWDGKDSQGREVASGIYLYRLTTRNFNKIKKMLMIK